MSIASPTLRSSSSTVPGPSLSSSPTSMRAAEHRGHLHRHVEHRFEILSAAGGVAAAGKRIRIERRHRAGIVVQVGKLNLAAVTHCSDSWLWLLDRWRAKLRHYGGWSRADIES